MYRACALCTARGKSLKTSRKVGLLGRRNRPSRSVVPEAQRFEEPAAGVGEEMPSASEPVVEDVAQVFEKVISMSADRVQKLATHRKYSKAASSFPGYNFGQAFSRGLNDIAMVSSPRTFMFIFSEI